MESKKTYFEYLDALRCLAFLLVFYAHTGTIFSGVSVTSDFPLNLWMKFTVYGSYGVNFFFVLSGFLITFLLLKEKQSTGTVTISKFYLKRILRIWPVYFATFIVGAFVLPFLISESTYSVLTMTNPIMSFETLSYFLFFLGNFYQGLGLGIASLSIGILWSVCIEEQFYLVWPWIVKWCTTRKLLLVTLLLVSLSLLYKFIWAEDRLANYYLPWSVGMDLGFGALLGIGYFLNKKREVTKYSLIVFTVGIVLIAITAAFTYSNTAILKSSIVDILRLVKTPLIDCIFILTLLFFVERTNSFYKQHKHPLLQTLHTSAKKVGNATIYLGKISYGLYAYHTICLMLVASLFYKIGFLSMDVSRTAFFTTIGSSFILTVTVAHLSSKYMEKYFTNLKNKLT